MAGCLWREVRCLPFIWPEPGAVSLCLLVFSSHRGRSAHEKTWAVDEKEQLDIYTGRY